MEIELSSSSGDTKIIINLLDWQYPKVRSGSDSEWLFADLSFRSPMFSAQIKNNPFMQFSELSNLAKGINNILSRNRGKLSFSTLEPYFKISLELMRNGSILILGTISDLDRKSGHLDFTFSSDQSCLNLFIKSLEIELKRLKRK